MPENSKELDCSLAGPLQVQFSEPAPTTVAPDKGTEKKKLSTEAKVGIAVGATFGAFVLTLFIWWCMQRKKKQNGQKTTDAGLPLLAGF